MLATFLILLSKILFAGPDGRELYEEHCSVCHQTKGWGGIGLPLKVKHIQVFSDDYLEKTIRLGRPGRVMPAFDALGDAQVKALVSYVRSLGGKDAIDFPTTHIVGDIEAGKTLFSENCAVCHGKDRAISAQGTGVTLSRERDFSVIPPSLLNTGFLQSASDHMIRYIVVNGVEATAMPAFGKNQILTKQQIDNVVSYLRSQEKVLLTKEKASIKVGASVVFKSEYDFKTTIANIKESISGANFRSFPDRYLEQGLVEEIAINKKQVGIRFCNFESLYKMLNLDPRLGVVLPCRLTVVERDDGEVYVYAINVKVVSQLFNNEELSRFGEKMEEIQMTIIDEAVL